MSSVDKPAVSAFAWRDRGALTLCFLTNGVVVGGWAVSQPILKERLGLDDWGLSNVALAYAVGSMATMPLVAWVSPKLGSGRTALIAAFACALLLALVPVAPGLIGLCLTAFVMGGMVSSQSVAMNAHGSRLETKLGRPIISSLHAAYAAGTLAGSFLGGTVIDLHPSLGAWVPAAVAVVLNLVIITGLSAGERIKSNAAIFAAPERGMLGLAGLILFSVLIEASMLNWSAVYLTGVVGVSASAAAAGFSGFAVGMTTARLAGDAAVRAWGAVRVAFLGGCAATTGLIMVAAAPSYLVAVAGFVLIGIGVGNIPPIAYGAAMRLTKSPASGVAMVSSAAYTAFIAGPPLIGAVASATDLRAGMGILIASGLMVMVGARAMRATAR